MKLNKSHDNVYSKVSLREWEVHLCFKDALGVGLPILRYGQLWQWTQSSPSLPLPLPSQKKSSNFVCKIDFFSPPVVPIFQMLQLGMIISVPLT